MTTVIEQKVLTKAFAAVKKYGTTATFNLYPAATVDENASAVTLGSPTNHVVRITPPENLDQEFSMDGQLVEREGVKFYVASGELTSEEITFVPEIGQRVTVRAEQYRVRRVSAVVSGDHVALYEVEARK